MATSGQLHILLPQMSTITCLLMLPLLLLLLLLQTAV
jgi:hypothetical protein